MTKSRTPQLLNAAQAAERLGISRRALLHRISKGQVEATKVGDGITSGYVIAETEVDRLVKAAS